MDTMRRDRCRDRGTTSLEWVGMVVVAALLCVPVLTVATKSPVGEAVKAAICRITGGDCPSPGEVAIDTYLPQCEVSSTAYSGEAEVTVFSVNAGGKVKMSLKEVRTPEGKTMYVVEDARGGQLGAHVMFGEEGQFGLGEGLKAEAKAGLVLNGSTSYSFTSRQEAEKFLQASAKELGKDAAASSTGPLSGVTKWGLDAVDQMAGGEKYDPPPPYEYYVDGGFKVSAEASAKAGPEATVSTESVRVLGVKVRPGRDGAPTRRTVYVKGTDKLAAEIGLGPFKAGPGGDSEVVVGLTYEDGSSEPVAARIEAAGKMNDPAGVKGTKKDVGAKGSKLGLALAPNQQGKFVMDLNLKNTANRDALADVLQSTGMPLMRGSGRPGYQDPVTAVAGLRDRFTQGGPREGASFSSQTVDGASGEFKAGFFAGDLITFGAGGKLATETASATSASYYDPAAGGMVPWKRCSR